MTDRRIQLHNLLAETFPEVGNRLYFRPPPTLEAEYPQIRYELQEIVTHKALNSVYSYKQKYKVTIFSALPGFLDVMRFMKDPRVVYITTFTHNNVVNTIYEITM